MPSKANYVCGLPIFPSSLPSMVKRSWGATKFLDHVSDYGYVHLMRDLTLDETLLAKGEMEKVMEQVGIYVKHYHADNGIFADNGFINAINTKDQKITFCGVGAHHQNGIIENKKKMLILGACTLLLIVDARKIGRASCVHN